MTLEELLGLLEGVRHHGNYDTARCPVTEAHSHGDRNPSLSIRVNDNGWIQLKCHANCAEESILGALKLENSDLLTTGINFGKPLKTWYYRDEEGTPLFQTLRYPPKRFRARHYDPEHPDADKEGWVWGLRDARRVLYNLPEVLAAIEKGEDVYVVEGEKDADTLSERWKVTATCNPGGAGKWRREYTDSLQGAKVIVVIDRDGPGKRHGEQVVTSLQGKAESIEVLQPKVGFKDISEHIEAGHSNEEMEHYRIRSRRGVLSAREAVDLLEEEMAHQLSDIPAFVLTSEVPVVFRLGRTYAIGAYTGHGKTSFGLPGFRNLCEQGHRCGYFTLEMPTRDLINKLIAHKGLPLLKTENPLGMTASEQLVYRDAKEEIKGWDADLIFESKLKAQRIREITELREYEVIFVDHIHKLSWGNDRRTFEEEVQNLNSIALDLNVLVILFCQLRKYDEQQSRDAPRPTLQSFRETSTIAEEASMALGIWRQTTDQGTQFTGETHVFVLKNRHTTSREDQAGKMFSPGFDPRREMFIPKHLDEAVVDTNGHMS